MVYFISNLSFKKASDLSCKGVPYALTLKLEKRLKKYKNVDDILEYHGWRSESEISNAMKSVDFRLRKSKKHNLK